MVVCWNSASRTRLDNAFEWDRMANQRDLARSAAMGDNAENIPRRENASTLPRRVATTSRFDSVLNLVSFQKTGEAEHPPAYW